MECSIECTDKRTNVSTNGISVIYRDKWSFLLDFMTLEMKAIRLFETSETAHSKHSVIF